MSYTEEQLKYINYDKKKHTKLLACAGSGKTKCIIARMSRLITDEIYDPNEILMLTFSRFTRDDFLRKIKTYCEEGKKPCISAESVNTIDSFAKKIIDTDGTKDVQLLSFKFMQFLETEPIENLKKIPHLNRIKTVFIDEAQDLNKIQYDIFCHMRNRLGIIVNMIGDPNQTIFQFRQSSDKYLREFDAVVFKLTMNFRSHKSIVDFSKHLRPFNEYDVVCAKGPNNCKPSMNFYNHEKILEDAIIDILSSAKAEGIDLSEFAILSPTRGRMRCSGRSHGLCFITNILSKAGIAFKQFYQESADENNGEGVKYEPVKDHVNVLTYMGSKGLEWNYVIIIDADMCLINKRHFDEEKHRNDQYLLYVACSRAIYNMYIFSSIFIGNAEPHFNTNPWFEQIPRQLYDIEDGYEEHFIFPELRFSEYKSKDMYVGKIIDRVDCYTLDKLSDLIGYQNRKIKFQNKIFKKNYATIEKQSSLFLSRYTEQLFHALYNIKMKRNHIVYSEIENIIEPNNVVTDVPEEIIKWYYANRKNMTWQKYDKDESINEYIRQGIDTHLNRGIDFDKHTLIQNNYYQWFILDQKIWIKNIYKKYLKCKNSVQIRELLFYLLSVMHGIETQHYFHIREKGKKYIHILEDFKDMFDDIETYVDRFDHNFVKNNEFVKGWDMICKNDLIDDKDKIWTVKCVNEISLKHTLQSIVGNLMHDPSLLNHSHDVDRKLDQKSNKKSNKVKLYLNYINFLKGEEICYKYKLSKKKLMLLIEILQMNSGETTEEKKLEENRIDESTIESTIDVNKIEESKECEKIND